MSVDYPRAWQITREQPADAHHEDCSYRATRGGILCDCEVLTKHPEYLDDVLRGRDGIPYDDEKANRGRLVHDMIMSALKIFVLAQGAGVDGRLAEASRIHVTPEMETYLIAYGRHRWPQGDWSRRAVREERRLTIDRETLFDAKEFMVDNPDMPHHVERF